MPITLATSSGTIALHDDTLWSDEFNWTPAALAKSVTLGGALIVEASAMLAGRPITLVGGQNFAWIAGDVMESLRAAEAAQGDTPFTLTLLDGRTFSVLFDGQPGSPAVSGTQVDPLIYRTTTERDGYHYVPTVRLIQVG